MNGSEPLTPIKSPLEAFGGIDPATVIPVAFALVTLVWIIYTLVISYHWLRYGHRSGLAVPALITHFAISLLLALYAVSGLIM